MTLTREQVDTFLADGVVVVPGVLNREEVDTTRAAFHQHLKQHSQVDINDLPGTAHNLRTLSSTGGAGGVLDIYYAEWRLRVCEHPKLVAAVQQIMSETYASSTTPNFEHPYGAFDPADLCTYMDRVCFRVPDTISALHRKKKKPLQRHLSPHFDCCPTDLFGQECRALESKSGCPPRWRPIQVIVALTDNTQPNTGGFECAPGFYKDFESYHANQTHPAACVGEFSRVRPQQDEAIINRMCPISVQAGDVIIFDYRTPHASAASNTSEVAREAIFTGFLPPVPLNLCYQKHQLERFRKGLLPDNHWSHRDLSKPVAKPEDLYRFSAIGKRLMGCDCNS